MGRWCPPLVIVGSGMAGYGLLRAMRRGESQRPVEIFTQDDGAAYSRAEFASALAVSRGAGDLVLATAEQMGHRLNATVRTFSRVLGIDRARRRLQLERGECEYGRLVLATGCESVRPASLRGNATDQVLTISSLAEYRYFNNAVAGRRDVVFVGGGLAGCELADNLASAGFAVTVLESGPQLMAGRVPSLSAAFVARAMRANGVKVVLEDGLQRVDHGREGLDLVALSGTDMRADVVVAALGGRPRTALASAAGLEVGRGVAVDSALRTADPHIHAIGECAEMDGRLFDLPDDIDVSARVLALVLEGQPARMTWRPKMRRPRFGQCPVVLCEPPALAGEWHEKATARGVRALFHDMRGDLRGFVLTGETADDADRLFRRIGGQ